MSFELHWPSSLAEAVQTAARHGERARFLAGGTDLLIQIRRRRLSPSSLIDVQRLPGLDRIAVNGAVTLGATVTHRAIERCAAFHGPLRGLVEAAEVVGGHQVRNVGTVGGNIVNASPAADVVPVLLALDARVACLGDGGERVLPLEELLVGPGRTALRAGELLTAVHFPGLAARTATAFLKAGRRRAMEISVACVAARLTVDASRERCLDVRIVLGAVGPTALRARRAERSLEGQVLTPAALARAGEIAADDCRPLDDVRASARYRRLLVRALVPRVLTRCIERIQEPGA